MISVCSCIMAKDCMVIGEELRASRGSSGAVKCSRKMTTQTAANAAQARREGQAVIPSPQFNLEFALCLGGTGDSPVPVGDPPTGNWSERLRSGRTVPAKAPT